MNKLIRKKNMNRREFNKLLTVASLGSPLFLRSSSKGSESKSVTDDLIHRNERPTMTYCKLGRTNYMSSKLVFGAGAALREGKSVRLLERSFEAGINHYDTGFEDSYKGSEESLAPFLARHKQEIWVASKAALRIENKPGEAVTLDQIKSAAKSWVINLDKSLKNLKTDYIDAYYLMMLNNPEIVQREELYNTFLEAKSAGKVGFFGLSTHENAEKVLEAAIATGWYDIVTPGITPAGWYDWNTKELAKDTPKLTELKPLFKKAKQAGIGLVGMKTARYIAPMDSLGKGDPNAFDPIYDDAFTRADLNPYQRAIVFVLEHGLDVVVSDMQNFEHLEDNIVACANSHKYFG